MMKPLLTVANIVYCGAARSKPIIVSLALALPQLSCVDIMISAITGTALARERRLPAIYLVCLLFCASKCDA